MPSLSGGGEVSLGWTYAERQLRVRAFATGTYLPHASRYIASNTGADFNLFAASARGCAAFSTAAFDLGPCLGAELGLMTATNIHAPVGAKDTAEGLWWSALGSAVGTWHVTPWFGVFLRADGVVPINAPRFAISQPPPKDQMIAHVVFQAPAVSLRTALGLEAHFF